MGMQLRFETHPRYLAAIVSGAFQLDEAVTLFTNILAHSAQAGLTRTLIDFRGLQGLPASSEKLLYAYQVIGAHLEHAKLHGPEHRLAYLGNEKAILSYEPGLDAALENSLPVAIFSDSSRAEQWLME